MACSVQFAPKRCCPYTTTTPLKKNKIDDNNTSKIYSTIKSCPSKIYSAVKSNSKIDSAQKLDSSYLSNFKMDSTYSKPSSNSYSNSSKLSSSPTSLKKNFSFSSSSDDQSDDEECYTNNQIKAKKRTNSRVNFCLDLKLEKAINQYSDDEFDISLNEFDDSFNNQSDFDCLTNDLVDLSRKNSFIDKNDLKEKRDSKDLRRDSKDLRRDSKDLNNFSKKDSSKDLKDSFSISSRDSYSSFSKFSDSESNVPIFDKISRSKCFDYLIGSIDEAWARYCNQATSVEDEVYGYNTPGSMIGTDDEDFDNNTDLTDYDDDFIKNDIKTNEGSTSMTRPRSLSINSTKSDPSSCKLQQLKDRLTKAKYYLQDLVDSDELNDIVNFWKRWDMIKYATIELVEDDDDDEIIESTIEDLESGRYYVN